jgi:hypothetical protein
MAPPPFPEDGQRRIFYPPVWSAASIAALEVFRSSKDKKTSKAAMLAALQSAARLLVPQRRPPRVGGHRDDDGGGVGFLPDRGRPEGRQADQGEQTGRGRLIAQSPR